MPGKIEIEKLGEKWLNSVSTLLLASNEQCREIFAVSAFCAGYLQGAESSIAAGLKSAEEKILQSAPPTNTRRQSVAQMPPSCAECYKLTGYICRYKYNSIYCQAKLWRHFCRA